MLAVYNAAIDWRAIRMDVEDRQKNSDTSCSRFEYLAFIRLGDVHDRSISGSQD
jgi:hypothetical protein